MLGNNVVLPKILDFGVERAVPYYYPLASVYLPVVFSPTQTMFIGQNNFFNCFWDFCIFIFAETIDCAVVDDKGWKLEIYWKFDMLLAFANPPPVSYSYIHKNEKVWDLQNQEKL